MKRIIMSPLFLLFLVNYSALEAMEGYNMKVIVNNPTLLIEEILKAERSTQLPENMDLAIKENISVNDPQAFEKITRYADILLSAFKDLVVKSKLNDEENNGLLKIQEMLTKIKNESAHKGPNIPKEVPNNVFLENCQKMQKKKNEEYIELWNITKTVALQTLDVIKKLKPTEIKNK